MANDWLGSRRRHIVADESLCSQKSLPNFYPRKRLSNVAPDNCGFAVFKHLDLQWLSENLPSKNSYLYFQTLKKVAFDVEGKLRGKQQFPLRILELIYNEFLSFCHVNSYNISVAHSRGFETLLAYPADKQNAQINQFIKEYSLKVATLYLMKLRFFREISKGTEIALQPRDLLSPNNLFLKVFQVSSSREFFTSISRSNEYSWYVPSAYLVNDVHDFFEVSDQTTYAEALSLLSGRVKGLEAYSHALRHKNTGLFINSVLLNYIQWSEEHGRHKGAGGFHKESLNILSSKFTGDHISELAYSHWLAQTNNSYFKWDDLLCSDFNSRDTYNSSFIKLVNELEFYSFLAKISEFYNASPVTFLSKCSKDFKLNRHDTYETQRSFVFDQERDVKETYNRVVLNLVQLPKKNPHHYLLTSIQKEIEDLKQTGHLMVLTKQNLFVPSQKQKVKALLKKLKLRAIFDLNELQSKGELAPFIYIFSKRELEVKAFTEREIFDTFKLTGELASFSDFHQITDELNGFWQKSLQNPPPFYRGETGSFSLSYFQDAILNGEMIHSHTEGSITHPKYFQNLLDQCVPLSDFFALEAIDIEKHLYGENRNEFQLAIESVQSNPNEVFPSESLAIIFNYADSQNLFLEITSKDFIKAKVYEYGLTSCYVYELYPKNKNININLFREYFNSKYAQQMIHMSLSGSYHQTKAKIAGLLIPSFFKSNSVLPEHLSTSFSYLTDEGYLKFENLSNLEQLFRQRKNHLDALGMQGYEKEILSYLVYFKINLSNQLEEFGAKTKTLNNLDFSLPKLRDRLCELDLGKLYPNNRDIFIEYHGRHLSDLSHRFDDHKCEYEAESIKITLKSSSERLVSIHCSKYLGAFLDFILPRMKNYTISEILKNLNVPRNEDLQSIIEDYLSNSQILEKLILQTSEMIQSIFDRKLFQS